MIVEPGYHDWRGNWCDANPDSLRLIRDLVDEHPPNAAAYEVAHASAPGSLQCVVPGTRQLGIAAQLYALWSEGSGGIGDFRDLATLAEESGAGVIMLSPLHAPLPNLPQDPSPYFPSSRQFRNPLHLRVDGVRLSNDPARAIDRNAVWIAKRAALLAEWSVFTDFGPFSAYCAREGDDLRRYATFCAERDGQDVAFHEWLQWRIDLQLADAAAAGAGLIHDLAVGFDPAGADAHIWRDLIAPDMHVGAPPDEFNQAGQDWGLPPFVPDRLSAVGHRPIAAALASAAAHGVGVRIDHVMGLFRQFWIPDGATPADGVYVRFPAAELLDVVAQVSRRYDVFVVGEDLGTVEPGVREALAARGVLSYKVLWFEAEPPSAWPALSLAAATTHDLPTITGKGESIDAVHRDLLHANSLLVLLTADDLVAARHQPNRPGVDDEWNWSRRLPAPVSEVAANFAASLIR